MNVQGFGRVAGILGSALTFFVGIISVVLGLIDSSTEQSGNSLIVRGLMLIGLSVVAGYGASLSSRLPGRAAAIFILVAVLGSVLATRSFLIAAAVLVVAAVVSYSARDVR
jgi:hypothetical protein